MQNLCEITIIPILPRVHKVPARFEYPGAAGPTTFTKYEDVARKEFFEILDSLCGAIMDRFDQHGLKRAAEMETFFLAAASDVLDEEQLMNFSSLYPELNYNQLMRQLPLLPAILKQASCNNTKDIQTIISSLKTLPSTTLDLIPDILKFIKLLLVFPSTAASAERSFSALRRIKLTCMLPCHNNA